jgi:hypothetical protein
MKLYRCQILMLAITCFLCAYAFAQSQSLTVERHGDHLHVMAAKLHFLKGPALEKLHNGATVHYIFTITVNAQNNEMKSYQLRERFAISYDLWEEKFSVVHSTMHNRSASRLSADMAETWCLENMPIAVREIPASHPFMVRLECSIDESEKEDGGKGDYLLSLEGLYEVFSRKRSDQPIKCEAASGSLRLDNLKAVKQTR